MMLDERAVPVTNFERELVELMVNTEVKPHRNDLACVASKVHQERLQVMDIAGRQFGA